VSYDAAGARRETPTAAEPAGETPTRTVRGWRSARFPRRLHGPERRRGDRAYYGALKLGAAFTGVNVLYREAEVAHQLNHARRPVLADERSRISSRPVHLDGLFFF